MSAARQIALAILVGALAAGLWFAHSAGASAADPIARARHACYSEVKTAPQYEKAALAAMCSHMNRADIEAWQHSKV